MPTTIRPKRCPTCGSRDTTPNSSRGLVCPDPWHSRGHSHDVHGEISDWHGRVPTDEQTKAVEAWHGLSEGAVVADPRTTRGSAPSKGDASAPLAESDCTCTSRPLGHGADPNCPVHGDKGPEFGAGLSGPPIGPQPDKGPERRRIKEWKWGDPELDPDGFCVLCGQHSLAESDVSETRELLAETEHRARDAERRAEAAEAKLEPLRESCLHYLAKLEAVGEWAEESVKSRDHKLRGIAEYVLYSILQEESE